MCNSLINPDKMQHAILTLNVLWSTKDFTFFHLCQSKNGKLTDNGENV